MEGSGRRNMNFVIALDETWNCQKHSQNKIFYCLGHSTPFCPSCLKDKHKDCFVSDLVFDAQNILSCLENRCKELKSVAQDNVKKIETLKEKCEMVFSSAMECKKMHAGLYELIKDHVTSITSKASGKKLAEDEELLAQGTSILKSIQQILKEYEKAIEEYDGISKKIQDKDIKELITLYQSLKNNTHDSYIEKYDYIISNINKFKDKLDISKIVYTELGVKDSLERNFKGIHSEGVSELAEQATADLAFALAPLSSQLCIYDLTTLHTTRKKLLYNNKSYKVPYGAGVAGTSGKIFITGGTYDLETPFKSFLEYSILTCSFIPRPEMMMMKMEHGCIMVGAILFCAGGRNDKGHLAVCEQYYTEMKNFTYSKEWTIGPSMNEPKLFPSLCTLKEEEGVYIYSFGGMVGDKLNAKVERLLFGKADEQWEVVEVATVLEVHSMGCIEYQLNKRKGILILGGLKGGNKRVNDAYFFDPSKDKCDIKRCIELATPKEEEYYYKPLMKGRGKQNVYAVCQSQLWELRDSKRKISWEEINCPVFY